MLGAATLVSSAVGLSASCNPAPKWYENLMPKSSSKLKKKRIAVFGGAYDPPTTAHLTVCSEVIHSGMADEVWMVPSGPRPDKPSMKTPAVQRMVMCELAVNTYFTPSFPVKVSDMEVFRSRAMFTYDMLTELKRENPDCDFYYVVGSDWLQPGTNIRSWRSIDPTDPTGKRTVVSGHKLVEEFDFLLLKRPGYEVADLNEYGPRFKWLDLGDLKFITSNLSSTELRKRMAADREAAGPDSGLSLVDGLFPPAVLAYIRRQSVY